MSRHHKTGIAGEELAVKYFSDKNYSILHRNWRFGNWEVDIIASKDNVLHFIEVKTRKSTTYGYPEEDAGVKKITNLINAAEEFMEQYPEWENLQFDILSILIENNKEPEFFLIEDVYV